MKQINIVLIITANDNVMSCACAMDNQLARSPDKAKYLNTQADLLVKKKTEQQKMAKNKQFDDFKILLEKLKTEFMERYNEGPKRKSDPNASLHDFDLLSTLGAGSFGCVILCKRKSSGIFYAVKVMNKAKILKDKQLEHTINEKHILVCTNFPFLIHMDFNFKDNCNVYFVLPFIAGGDMFTLLRRSRTFKEKDAKFYAAQVIMAIEYLHFMDIVYRDLKPENIVIDVNGYLKVTDFGFCKMIKLRTYTLCGTPEYLAPEIIMSKGYGKSVDWWSVGIFLYEMIAGYTPFYADEAIKIYEKITVGKYRFTPDFSAEARELIRNILQIDLSRRYGNLKNGVYDIKGHDWFKLVDWNAIYSRKAVAPFVPKIDSPDDVGNFDRFNMPKIQHSVNEKFPQEFAVF